MIIVHCALNNFNRLNFDWLIDFYVFVNFEINPKKNNCYITIVYVIGHAI